MCAPRESIDLLRRPDRGLHAPGRGPAPRQNRSSSRSSSSCELTTPPIPGSWKAADAGEKEGDRGRWRDVVYPTLPILPYDERVAEWLAEERIRLEKAGKQTPAADGQNAAVAATNGIPVVTANVSDFSIFKGGLAFQTWMAVVR